MTMDVLSSRPGLDSGLVESWDNSSSPLIPSAWVIFGTFPSFMVPFLQSLIYFTLILTLHVTSNRLYTTLCPSCLQPLIFDFISTVTCCTISYQFVFFRSYYGNVAYIVSNAVMSVFLGPLLRDSSPTVPVNVLKYLEGHLSFFYLLLRVFSQILAVPVTPLFVHTIWRLGIMPEHTQALLERTCYSDLNVAVAVGFLVEGFCTALDTWLSFCQFTSYDNVEPYVKLLLTPTMVVIGIPYTGLYMNPTLASARTFGCKGTGVWQHVMVYWLAPVAGCILGAMVAGYHQDHQHKLSYTTGWPLSVERKKRRDRRKKQKKQKEVAMQ
ncbi:aquaporin-11-like [Argonauta hians]